MSREKKKAHKFFLGDLISVMGLGFIIGRYSCYKFFHTWVGSVLVKALAHPHYIGTEEPNDIQGDAQWGPQVMTNRLDKKMDLVSNFLIGVDLELQLHW